MSRSDVENVSLKQFIEKYPCCKNKIYFPIAKAANDELIFDSFDDASNILVLAGDGGGKTIFAHSLTFAVASMYSPERVKFRIHESERYWGVGEHDLSMQLPHIEGKISHDLNEYINNICAEIEKRLSVIKASGNTDLAGYNASANVEDKMPHIICLLDSVLTDECDISFHNKLDYIMSNSKETGMHIVLCVRYSRYRKLCMVGGCLYTSKFPRAVIMRGFSGDPYIDHALTNDTKLCSAGDLLYCCPDGNIGPKRGRAPIITCSEMKNIIGFNNTPR